MSQRKSRFIPFKTFKLLTEEEQDKVIQAEVSFKEKTPIKEETVQENNFFTQDRIKKA